MMLPENVIEYLGPAAYVKRAQAKVWLQGFVRIVGRQGDQLLVAPSAAPHTEVHDAMWTIPADRVKETK